MDRATPALLLSLLAALLPVRAAAAAPARVLLQVDAGQRAAAAEALFDRGRQLMNLGRYAEACTRFADSERLDHGVGTLLNLADCYEKNGQTASAWAGFRSVAAAAIAERQPDRERIAREREIALLPVLTRLTIAPPAQGFPPGTEVHRDGILLGRSLWGAPVPVDPGDHAVVISAPGKVDYSTTVHVPRQASLAIVTRIPELKDRPAPPPVAPPPVVPPPPSRHPRATAGLVLLGLGGAGVAVGSILGVRALGLKEDGAARCHDIHCGYEGKALLDSATSAGTASTIAFIAAGAALTGGLVLYVTAPEPQAITASVGVSAGTAGFTMGATW